MDRVSLLTQRIIRCLLLKKKCSLFRNRRKALTKTLTSNFKEILMSSN